MIGNAWEWTQDCWNDSYNGAPENGDAWSEGNCGLRVLRGGSWSGFPLSARAASRGRGGADVRDVDIGLRLARTY
jgi:formylglycine-generating enzyme required for sulfatase activity